MTKKFRFYSVVLILAWLSLSGCSTLSYYNQAVRGHLDMMSRRVPIDDILNSVDADDSLKRKLRIAQDARDFASQHLALPDNDSYRQYADMQRPYVLWNVFATEEFSIAAKEWCYWFVGCLGYRGFFAEEKANQVLLELQSQNFDAFVGGVAAYSTLGRFADPLLNTMLNRRELYIPEVMFHELTHQQVYRAGDSEFSESMASFVQQEGVFRWLDERQDEAGKAEYRLSLQRDEDFVNLIITRRERLASLYQKRLSIEQMRMHKAAQFNALQFDYQNLKTSWGGFTGYDAWFAQTLNNAHLVSVSTYNRLVPAFRVILAESGGDMQTFFERCAELAELEDDALALEMNRYLERSLSAMYFE